MLGNELSVRLGVVLWVMSVGNLEMIGTLMVNPIGVGEILAGKIGVMCADEEEVE